jgi:hypothetical protein
LGLCDFSLSTVLLTVSEQAYTGSRPNPRINVRFIWLELMTG